jgi:hypothetical protein
MPCLVGFLSFACRNGKKKEKRKLHRLQHIIILPVKIKVVYIYIFLNVQKKLVFESYCYIIRKIKRERSGE